MDKPSPPKSKSLTAWILIGVGLGVFVLAAVFSQINSAQVYQIPGRCQSSAERCDQLLDHWRRQRNLIVGSGLGGIIVFGAGSLYLAKIENRLPGSRKREN